MGGAGCCAAGFSLSAHPPHDSRAVSNPSSSSSFQSLQVGSSTAATPTPSAAASVGGGGGGFTPKSAARRSASSCDAATRCNTPERDALRLFAAAGETGDRGGHVTL